MITLKEFEEIAEAINNINEFNPIFLSKIRLHLEEITADNYKTELVKRAIKELSKKASSITAIVTTVLNNLKSEKVFNAFFRAESPQFSNRIKEDLAIYRLNNPAVFFAEKKDTKSGTPLTKRPSKSKEKEEYILDIPSNN